MTTSLFPWEKKPSFPWDKPSSTDFRADTSIPVQFGAPKPDFPPVKPLALGVPSSRPLADLEKPSFPWEKKSASLGKRANYIEPVSNLQTQHKFPWEKQDLLKPVELIKEVKEETKPEPEEKVPEKNPVEEEKEKLPVKEKLSVIKKNVKSVSAKSSKNERYSSNSLKESETTKEETKQHKDVKKESTEKKTEKNTEKKTELLNTDETPKTESDIKLEKELQEKVNEVLEKEPKTSPGAPSRSSSVSSVRKMYKSPSQSSVFTKGPVTAPPKHINRRSEKLAKNYKSACAKPKIAPHEAPVADKEGKEGEKTPPKKLSLRTVAHISNWVPAPTEVPGVTTWGAADKRAAEYGDGLGPGVTMQTAAPASSADIRDAVFMEWVEKKKKKRVTKYNPDPVLVIANPEECGVPSADAVRQATFDDWYRKRATAQDKKIIKSLEEEENRQKLILEREEETKRKTLATRKAWEANDDNRKKLIKCKKKEEAEKMKKLQEGKEEKLKVADKSYAIWKEKKDEKMKGEVKKKVVEEKESKKEKIMEEENKLTDAEKTYKAWKEAKDREIRTKQVEQRRLKEQKELETQAEKYKKEKERRDKVRDWEERKEQERNEINIPKHISPWKTPATTANTPTRDDKLMANLKYKKTREKMKSPEKCVEIVA